VRVCSLLPAATEILYALGLGESVAGVSHECNYPPEAASKPALIRPRLDPGLPPAEIDRRVSELVARGESLYAVDAGRLAEVAPDLIITQDLCHVCAASPDDLPAALARLEPAPRILSLSPRHLADVWADIRRVGEATGRVAEAEALAGRLERRVEEIRRLLAGAPRRPPVLCLEWLDPPYLGGHWVPEMVACAGGLDALGQPGEPSFRRDWPELLAAQADLVFVMPCGYGLDAAVREYRSAKLPPGWDELPAVRAGRVFAMDANSYFSRPGPRLVTGIEILARLLHPDRAAWPLPAGACVRVARERL
jgi:iron complex transport system substrate-binding protein